MKLYGNPASTCTRKVLCTLHEKNATFDFQNVDLGKGEQKKPEHLARQPFGVVPVLEDGSFQMYESRAIIRYLDAKLPGVKLTPERLEDRARMEQWTSVEYSYFTPAAMKMIMQNVFAKWRGAQPDQAAIAKGREQIATSVEVIDKWFAKNPFFSGETFSLADISFMPYVQYLFDGGDGEVISSKANFSAWWNRVSVRPSWKKTLGK
jgi:glutathione S-transferase